MGILFWFFSFISGYVAILLLALSIASGLYVLSELAEEYTSLTGKALKYSLGGVFFLQFILWLDGLPNLESFVGFIALICYGSMLIGFPFMEFFSVQTLSSIIMFIATNALWLKYFLSNHYDALSIIGYFVVIVWAVPCGVFISMSVNDSVLPGIAGKSSSSDNGLGNTASSKKTNIFRAFFDSSITYLTNFSSYFGNFFYAVKLLNDKRR